MQKNQVKAFICCRFSIMSERMSLGLIENLAQLKLFSFKHISNVTQKGLGVFIYSNLILISSISRLHIATWVKTRRQREPQQVIVLHVIHTAAFCFTDWHLFKVHNLKPKTLYNIGSLLKLPKPSMSITKHQHAISSLFHFLFFFFMYYTVAVFFTGWHLFTVHNLKLPKLSISTTKNQHTTSFFISLSFLFFSSFFWVCVCVCCLFACSFVSRHLCFCTVFSFPLARLLATESGWPHRAITTSRTQRTCIYFGVV